MSISIVVGLGFGDEGKGVVTSTLVRESKRPLVIRFNGGHQAGHTVVKEGHRHIFSSFGSGTLHGAPTYWSKYCTVSPHMLLNEFELLKPYDPQLYIDPLCPITTWMDVECNQMYGAGPGQTVGVGFGTTLSRQQNHFCLYAKDLKYPVVVRAKLDIMQRHLYSETYSDGKEHFMQRVEEMLALPNIIIDTPFLQDYNNIIFEGAQGILLDQRHGFFPYVTRSNTTSKNAIKIMKAFGISEMPNVYMVTRAYHTRHGAGPLFGEGGELKLRNNQHETNKYNEWQGEFRVAPLNQELLKYAIETDLSESIYGIRRIIMTCCDQVEEIPRLNTQFEVRLNSSPEGNFYDSHRTISERGATHA